MSTLITNADGNLTGAATFAAAEVGANALTLVRSSTTTFAAAAASTSSSFTVTSGKVIDAILLYVFAAAGATGTFKVDLQKGGVSQASVTVNKADLPDSTNAIPVPVLFKLSSTATGDGGSNWTIVVTTTGTGTVTYNRATSTTANFTRALRTTTAATAAAGDDLYVVGELTGAGTHNSRVVTMNSTAATAYGNGAVNSATVSGGLLAVGPYGALSYGTTASTNYVLRVAGDLVVYQYGTLSIGASGAEIPRSSTAVLEFQPVSADGDFGLQIRGGTWNGAGLSRTSGKNVVQCKLTADVVSSSVLGTSPTTVNATISATSIGADGMSVLAMALTDSVTNATHSVAYSSASITNTTQTAAVWLARGSGTNNRYVRLHVANTSSLATAVNGFYVDVDLQAGTVGTATAFGNGTATSASITAVGGGYLVKLTGKCSSGAASPNVLINICSAAGTTSFAGANNLALIYDHVALVTTASISDTTFNVDTDTGWLSGDVICVAATTRTRTECEIYPINAYAGASSLVSGLYPFGTAASSNTINANSTHHGTAPVQAEIGLLTRNVKIRSTSPTLMYYLYCTAQAAVNVAWVEFYYIGATGSTKRGIEIDGGATTTAKSITYCSLHDCDNTGFYGNALGASLNLTFSNNVLWYNHSGDFFTINSAVSSGDWTIEANLMMLPANDGFTLNSVTGVCTNNTVVGSNSINAGFNLADGSLLPKIGTFSHNTAHSGAYGLLQSCTSVVGVIDGFTAWRNLNPGVAYNTPYTAANLTFNDLTLFGNGSPTSGNFAVLAGDAVNITGSSVIAGDTTFSSSYAFYFSSIQTVILLDISGVDASGVDGIYAPHTLAEFGGWNGSSALNLRGVIKNYKLGASVVANKLSWCPDCHLSFERYNQTNGDHRVEMTYGQLKTDATFYHTASPSMRMTPSSASNKLQSATPNRGVLVPVASGSTASVSVYIQKDASYNGNQPRLIQRANPALGQNSDVVLATYSAGTGSWNQLSGTSSTATDDGAWEFSVDCDGTTGFINVDDWFVS